MSGNKGEFHIEVQADGTIKVTTPNAFAPEIHQSADEFFAALLEASGGVITEHKDLKPGHVHTHRHADGTVHTHAH